MKKALETLIYNFTIEVWPKQWDLQESRWTDKSLNMVQQWLIKEAQIRCNATRENLLLYAIASIILIKTNIVKAKVLDYAKNNFEWYQRVLQEQEDAWKKVRLNFSSLYVHVATFLAFLEHRPVQQSNTYLWNAIIGILETWLAMDKWLEPIPKVDTRSWWWCHPTKLPKLLSVATEDYSLRKDIRKCDAKMDLVMKFVKKVYEEAMDVVLLSVRPESPESNRIMALSRPLWLWMNQEEKNIDFILSYMHCRMSEFVQPDTLSALSLPPPPKAELQVEFPTIPEVILTAKGEWSDVVFETQVLQHDAKENIMGLLGTLNAVTKNAITTHLNFSDKKTCRLATRRAPESPVIRGMESPLRDPI